MALVGKQGDEGISVCFGEDGYFYLCSKDENGYDVPDLANKLKSVNGEWHTFDKGELNASPHNEFYESNLLELPPGGTE